MRIWDMGVEDSLIRNYEVPFFPLCASSFVLKQSFKPNTPTFAPTAPHRVCSGLGLQFKRRKLGALVFASLQVVSG